MKLFLLTETIIQNMKLTFCSMKSTYEDITYKKFHKVLVFENGDSNLEQSHI